MAYVTQHPEYNHVKRLLNKSLTVDHIVKNWAVEEVDACLTAVAKNVSLVPSSKTLRKKSQREQQIVYDGFLATVVGTGTESLILKRDMCNETERYLSFFHKNWPNDLPVSSSKLAKAGFFYVGVNDTVQCFSCSGRASNWHHCETPMGEHKRLFPNCKFVRGVDNANVVCCHLLEEIQSDTEENVEAAPSSRKGVSDSEEDILKIFKPLALQESKPSNETKDFFKREMNRLLSFKRWPITNPVNRYDLAAAGFYWVNDTTVQCFACFGRISEWRPGDRPKDEHRRLFRACPFISGRRTENIPISQHEESQVYKYFAQNTARKHQPQLNHPDKVHEQSRLATYESWPRSHCQAPVNLARAGFFATGNGDVVKCFYCGGGLENWERGDDPWEEHARWFPECEWLLQQKGPGFVDIVRRKFSDTYIEPEVEREVQECRTVSNQNLDTEDMRGWTRDERDENLESKLPSVVHFRSIQNVKENNKKDKNQLIPDEGILLTDGRSGSDSFIPKENMSKLRREYLPILCGNKNTEHFRAKMEELKRNSNNLPDARSSRERQKHPKFPNLSDDQIHHLNRSTYGHTLLPLSLVPFCEPTDFTVKYAKYPGKGYEFIRLETYHLWQGTHNQTPASLANAGFFATGEDDEVKCFSCGGGLKDWGEGDDPWEEHARWFPKCEWLLQQRGPGFVETVRRKCNQSYLEPNAAISPHQYSPRMLSVLSQDSDYTNDETQIVSYSVASHPEAKPRDEEPMKDAKSETQQVEMNLHPKRQQLSDMRVQEAFQSDVVQLIIDMGYDEQVVKSVIRKRLRSGKGPHEKAEDLLTAIFNEEDSRK